MEIEDAVERLGHEVVGPIAELDEALDLAANALLDCAILDINIRGGHSYLVADILLNRGLPVLLASGYGEWNLPKRLHEEARLPKPFTEAQLDREIRDLCARVLNLAY
jgi:two-component SAPR family response regulator